MAKLTSYECDICGKPIQTKYREVSGPSGLFTSTHPSFMRLALEQMDIDRGYPERQLYLDICDECNQAIRDLIDERRDI